jgi:hypothetical protein
MMGAEALSSLKNQRFVMIENKPFIMAILLIKQSKFNQDLIIFVKELLIKIFSSNNNKLIGDLYTNLINFFGKLELYNLLGLSKYVNSYGLSNKVKMINRDIFKVSRIDKGTKMYLYLYLYITYHFFNYISFLKMINILGKVLLFDSKEKKIDNLIIVLESFRKIYSTKLRINSLKLLIRLIIFFLDLKKILKSMYLMK